MTKLERAIKSGQITPEMTFEQKVWAVTARIPKGRVVCYAQIARALGTKAHRTVGKALSRNPYSPDVPCHRVVKSDGSLGGYSRGVKLKRRLLEQEGVKFTRGGKVHPSSWFLF